MKERLISKIVAYALIISVVFTMCIPQGMVFAEDGTGGNGSSSITIDNHSLTWIAGSSGATISGTNLTTEPTSNDDTTVTARIQFSCGGDGTIKTGDAVLRIPRYIFFDRNGKPIGTVAPAIPKAPATGGATSFNYTIDTKNDADPSNDEIVITNYADLAAGAFTLKCDLVYHFNPVDVANGYTKDGIKVSFSAKADGEDNPVTTDSQELSLKVITKAKPGSSTKQVSDKYENWQEAWGPRPANANDYYYVVWSLRQVMTNTANTSAYTVNFEEMPGAKDAAGSSYDTNTPGEIVAWANYNYNGGTPTSYGSGKSTDFKQGTLAEMNAEPVIINSNTTEVKSTSRQYPAREVVLKYPKDSIPPTGDTPTLSNAFKTIITTPEGNVETTATSSSYKYQRVSLQIDYPGDSFVMFKRHAFGLTQKDSKLTKNLKGGVNMLKNGTPVEGDWTIGIQNFAWNKTEKGTKVYSTVLRDGMVYAGGQRLTPDDYELTKFYPAQYDISVPIDDPNLGKILGTSTDYKKDYAPITVEIKDAAGNWFTYGTITKIGSTLYKWDGPGAKTQSYTTGGQVTNKTNAVALPAGTQDIRFTHTDKQYGVTMRMGLFYKLKPSTRILNLIGSNNSSFELMNIGEGWGEQTNAQGKREIFTGGNHFGGSSTPSLMADLEAQDTAEFGGTNVVYHDFSAHSITAVTPSGNFTKSMAKTPTNEVAKQRVKIPVRLAWDYYYNYSTLGVTIDEAISANIIKESREGDFYDLLPPGVTVDVKSVRVTTYSTTNVDNKTVPPCETTVELVDNWRDSGQTMMIIHAKVPEGYRNFAKSSSYVNTGFVVNFDMYDSWDNIETNGTDLVNGASYFCKEGAVPGGVSDTGVGSTNPTLFADSDNDKGASGLVDNVKYSKATTNVNVPRSSQTGFYKRVKGAGDTEYKKDTTVPATGSYSYQLRFAIEDASQEKGFVMYDVFETAHGTNDHWKGTFAGVDVSQIKRVAPSTDIQIYYSTSKDIGDVQATTGTDYSDLTNTTIWSKTEPSDLSKVTAIAIDLRKTKTGSTANYQGPLTLSAVVSMRAPADYNTTAKAYNQAVIKFVDDTFKASDMTTVSLSKPSVSLAKTSDPASGVQSLPRPVVAGDDLTYTLTAKNTNVADPLNDMEIVDVIPDGLEVDTAALAYYFGTSKADTQIIDGTGRVKVVVSGQTLTFTVDKLLAWETVNIVVPTKIKDDVAGGTKLTNGAEITKFNGENWTEYKSGKTYHQTTSTTLTLPVSKIVSGEARPADYRKTFTFTLEAVSNAPMPTGAGNTVTITDSGLGNFGEITYTKPGDYQYLVKETKGNDVGYTYDEKVHHVTVHVVLANDVLRASYTDADAAQGTTGIVFQNKYQPVSDTVSLKVAKTITGHDRIAAQQKTFTFTLSQPEYQGGYDYAAHNEALPMPATTTSTIKDAGNATFGTMEINHAGTYTYNITEKKENEAGYIYDTTVWKAIVTATEQGGKISTSVKYVKVNNTGENTTAASFENEYHPAAAEYTPTVTKTVTGSARPTGNLKTFTFDLAAVGNAPLPTGNGKVATCTDANDTSFGKISFTQAGTYEYTITERDEGEPGYTYSTEQYKLTVQVVDKNGTLEATATYKNKAGETKTNAAFENDYTPGKVTRAFTVKKAIDGNDRPAGNLKDFDFTMTAIDNAPMPAAGGEKITITDAGTGTFGSISYSKPGTYQYEIRESEGTEPGYTYSNDVYRAKVIVVDDNGTLKAATTFTKGGIPANEVVFTNEYHPTVAEYTPTVTKTITGSARPTGNLKTFTFDLAAVGNAPLPTGNGKVATCSDADDTAFGKITYNKAGTYEYTITERDEGEPGYTYSTEEYKLTVQVVDKNGTLEATATYKNGAGAAKTNAAFENDYTPGKVTRAFTVQKAIEGNDRPSNNQKDFDFTLMAIGNAPMPAAGGEKVTITDAGTGTFGNISYTKPGTYQYEIKETAGGAAGYTYSDEVYEVKVVVNDENGVLTVMVEYSKEGDVVNDIVFTNEYHPTATEVVIPVSKTLTGDARPAKESTFEFKLKSDGTVPMPFLDGTIAKIVGQGDGEFGKITFTEAGTYTYEVTETNKKEKGYTYDASVYTVTVEVTDDEAQLQATLSYSVDGNPVSGIEFVNKYTKGKNDTSSTVTNEKNKHNSSGGNDGQSGNGGANGSGRAGKAQTGDDTEMALPLATMLAGLGALLALAYRRRRD